MGFERLENLPTMPENATRLLLALSDERVEPGDIAELLMRDMAMSANVLRVANSVFYLGAGKPIIALDRAVARIGLFQVRNIVMAAGIIQAFSSFASKCNAREFWKHAVSVAMVTEILGRRVHVEAFNKPDSSQTLYFAGLLQDVGLLLLGHVFPSLFEKLRELAAQSDLPLKTLENNLMETDHGEIGAWLVQKWNLPTEVCDAVRYHHFPDAAPEATRPFAEMAHVANYICAHENLGATGLREEATFYEKALYDLGLELGDLPAITERVRAEAEKGINIILK